MTTIRTCLGALGLALTLAGTVPAAAADLRSHQTDLGETLAAGTTLEIDNLLGSIVATRAPDGRATIHADATSREADPARVVIREIRTPGRLLVCAVYPGDEDGDCRHHSHDRDDSGGTRDVDIRVDFTLAVPDGVRLVANSVDGNVRAIGLHSDVRVATVRGDVTLANDGLADATTVDGSLDVRLSKTEFAREQQLRTVNGPIHVTLARGTNLTLDAATISGAIRGERGFALATQDGTYVGHSATAKLGTGGARLSLRTVNGEISVGLD